MERIQELRKQRGLSQAALGEKLGVKQNTISQWESGARHLDDKTLSLLADVFGVSVDSLLGRAQNEWLQPLLEAYLRAPDWVRHRVCRTLSIEYLHPAAAPGWVTRPIYRDPAAAGVPLDASPDWETVDFPAGDVPKEALFGVRIQGDSMEPAYKDGDIVFIHKQDEPVREGEIGVFSLNGEGYMKRLGHKELESLNPKYPAIPIRQYDDLRCFGKVLGKLSK